MYTIKLKDVSQKNLNSVGGKGASLGELIQHGIPVPQGFIITTKAYKDFHNYPLPKYFIDNIYKNLDQLATERVAVRSSAISEDSLTASWAGQLDSYLNVAKESLLENIKKCWSSIQSSRAREYIKRNNIPSEQSIIAVVVQKMINSDISGVMFTKNPVTSNTDEIMIESCYGLGELLVQGEITPDSYTINKKTLEVKESIPGNQGKMMVYRDGKNRKISLPEKLKDKLTLNTNQIKELIKLERDIEAQFQKPQDIEWAFENDHLYILQSRPVTS